MRRNDAAAAADERFDLLALLDRERKEIRQDERPVRCELGSVQ
jgi:hypothetical protein